MTDASNPPKSSAFSNHSRFELLNLGSNPEMTGKISHPSATRTLSATSLAALRENRTPSTYDRDHTPVFGRSRAAHRTFTTSSSSHRRSSKSNVAVVFSPSAETVSSRSAKAICKYTYPLYSSYAATEVFTLSLSREESLPFVRYAFGSTPRPLGSVTTSTTRRMASARAPE